MSSFQYTAPTTWAEALEALSTTPNARPMAGGSDLLVQLRHELRQVALVVDIKRIPEAQTLNYDPTAGLTIGAAVSCSTLKRNPDVQAHYAGLIDGASIIGGSAVQNRATVVGNLCNAAPSADAIPPMIVLNAVARVLSAQGERTIPVAEFCVAPGISVLQADDLVVEVTIPAPKANSGAAYLRFTPRHEMDIAVAGAAAYVELDGDTITGARIALSSVAPTPLFVPTAGQALVGQTAGEAAYELAAKAAQETAKPISDMRGSAAQRTHLIGVLVKRALRRAVERQGEK